MEQVEQVGQVEQMEQVEQVKPVDGLPKCTIREAEAEPTSSTAACASKYSESWKKSMNA